MAEAGGQISVNEGNFEEEKGKEKQLEAGLNTGCLAWVSIVQF